MYVCGIQLYTYHVWANRRLLDHLATLPGDIFDRRVESVFPSINHALAHMFAVDEMWFYRLQGDFSRKPSGDPFESLLKASEAFARLHQSMQSYLTDGQLNFEQTVSYTNSKGETFRNSILEIVQHMINHGTYHRGNISAMLHQMGHRGVSTDFIIFSRENRL